jgi:hypothetical protein
MVTRRQAMVLLAAVAQVEAAPLDALDLPPELAAEIERDAAGALRQARLLDELPLDELPPGFVFRP